MAITTSNEPDTDAIEAAIKTQFAAFTESIAGGIGGEAGGVNLSPPAATPGDPTFGGVLTDPTAPVPSPAPSGPTEPAPPGGDPTQPIVDPTDTQGTPSATPVSQTTRETLEAAQEAPLDTLEQKGLTQSVVKLEVGDDEIIADPTVFNVAANTEPALDLDNLAQATAPELDAAQKAEADLAVIAEDYELSLLSPEEMGQNLDRLRDEEPMQAASMTEELTKLLDGMENGEIPLWAKPAVTKVEQQLAARGIGASSIGRDALFNAIIQAAMPIAQQDASFKQDANRTNYNAKVQAIFSDVAAENAAKQFNATSENQKNQFMTSLQANLDSQTAARKDAVSQFNAAEANKLNVVGAQLEAQTSQFNAAQSNAAAQFTDQMDQQRALFNSQQSAAIEQSNVSWRRQTNQINTAVANQVNQTNTQNAFNLSAQATAFLWQEERDEAAWANQATENEKTQRNNLEVAVMANEFTGAQVKGGWVANAVDALDLLDKIFD